MNVVEVADRIRPDAVAPLIVCESRTPRGESVGLWVFRENARNRLKRLWAGVLTRPEVDELVELLSRAGSVWLAGIDTRHPPPSKWFRLVWTLPPAPCRIYTRRGLATEVEPGVVTRHGSWQRRQIVARPVRSVEGWIARDWIHAGIAARGCGGEGWEVVRLKNAGSFTAFLLMYDGLDLLMDTGWLDAVVPRVADVFGVEWKIVDYTVAPPKIVRQGQPPTDPAASYP
jgi:hypothetical protein